MGEHICSKEWFQPIYELIHQRMRACEMLLGDETKIQCNRAPGKKASSQPFMWVMRTGAHETFQAVLFHYSRSRSGEEAKIIYNSFAGYLVTDAYKTSNLYTTNTALTKALTYSLNQRKYLETFLKDGRIPISNNLCEASIRPFANGRKSWLFADSLKEATASTIVYSLVETAKANKVDVYRYLEYLLEKIPNIDFRNHPELLEDYLPWSSSLPEYCKVPVRIKSTN